MQGGFGGDDVVGMDGAEPAAADARGEIEPGETGPGGVDVFEGAAPPRHPDLFRKRARDRTIEAFARDERVAPPAARGDIVGDDDDRIARCIRKWQHGDVPPRRRLLARERAFEPADAAAARGGECVFRGAAILAVPVFEP